MENNQAGSLTYPQQIGSLKKGAHVLIKGFPCKIIDISTSKTGKHGHAKANYVGIDIFTGKKYEDMGPTSHNTSVPHVSRKDYTVIDVNDDYVSLYDDETGNTREDLKVPEGEVGEKLVELFDNSDKGVIVTVLSSMGTDMIIACKENSK